MSDHRSLHRFYVNAPLNAGEQIQLSDEVSKQVRRVLRLKQGDHLVLFDGSGHETPAQIVRTGPEPTLVETLEEPAPGRTAGRPEIILGVALLKSDRFDLIVQKATELGVSRIVPMEAERCVVSLSADRARSRRERWQRIAIEALEQSGRSDFVNVEDVHTFSDALHTIDGGRRLIAWEGEISRAITDEIDGTEASIAILIGPEGGFTASEVSEAAESGFQSVSLGDLILRSETAAISVIPVIQTISRIRRDHRNQASQD